MIRQAAAAEALPEGFFTRLIWRESSFRSHVTSHAGAQGIAQFMPGTAAERGLADPFDPETAIPASASFLADLRDRFGNLGLAAAAYNAGPNRVASWRARGGVLPLETQLYVRFVTGRAAEDWSMAADGEPLAALPDPEDGEEKDAASDDCLTVVAAFRRGVPAMPGLREGPWAPWGVQVSGNFSKSVAIASYRRVAERHRELVSDRDPLVIGTRLAGRGRAPFYRVRMPFATRGEANEFCTRLQGRGGSCIVLRN